MFFFDVLRLKSSTAGSINNLNGCYHHADREIVEVLTRKFHASIGSIIITTLKFFFFCTAKGHRDTRLMSGKKASFKLSFTCQIM